MNSNICRLFAQTSHIRHLCLFALCLLLSVGIVSCAGKTRKQELLAQDHTQMSDEDVLLYYYQLNDEIETSERSTTGSAVSFGVGRGSYGGGSRRHGGIGVSSGGSRNTVATELRERRNLVRLELGRRNLTPK